MATTTRAGKSAFNPLNRAACGEDEEEFLMKKVKRAFRTVDKEDTGFVALDALGTVIRALGMKKGMPVPSAAEIQSLASILDTAGAGIVLWSDFTAPGLPQVPGQCPPPPRSCPAL